MKRYLTKTWVTFIFAFVQPVLGQITTGALSGFVFDPSGQPVSNAEVTVTDVQLEFIRRAATDPSGYYRIVELPARDYSASAKATGLAEVSTSVHLSVNAAVRVDFHLPIPGRLDSMTVRAKVSLLETESSDLGQAFEQANIERLPLNKRDFLQLALLTPGVVPAVKGSQLSSRGSFAMHVNGGREEFNNFLLDGVDNNDQENNRYNLQPPIDAIQEFKIATSSYSAEYGRSPAGQVNVVTRTGTNEWHAFAYDYLRNKVFDARNFFEGDKKAEYIRNQFGSGGGGPLKKEQTFIFADFDAFRERSGQSQLAAVPSKPERQGDFSGTGITVLDPFTGRPFPRDQIPPSRISPLAGRILDLYPLPNLAGSSGNYLAQPILQDNYTQLNIRLDHRLSTVDQLTTRYSYGARTLFEPFASGGTNVPGFGNFVTDRGHNAMVQEVHTFEPHAVNSLLLGLNRAARRVLPQNYATNVNQLWGVGYLPTRPIDFGYPAIHIAGFSALGDATSIPIDRTITTYQLTDTLSVTRGFHNLSLGAEVRNIRQDGILDELVRGSLSFPGSMTGSGIGDVLLGLPSFAIQARADNPQNQRTTAYNSFLQDDWKVRRNLMLNLGVRYEYNTPPTDPENRMSAFNVKTRQLSQVGAGGVSRSGIQPAGDNFAPRLGLAWAVTPNTVIRSGYGIYYDAGMLVVNSALYFNPPYFSVRIFYPSAVSLVTLEDPFPTNRGVTPPPSLNTLSADLTTAYLQNWNLNLQRELSWGGTLSIAYVGSKGTHLIRSLNLNQPLPGPGPLAPRRPYPQFGNVDYIESGANSNYNSLQISYRHPIGRSLSVLALYTYSKSIDDTSAFIGDTSDPNFPQNSRNFHAERALSSFDMRHRGSTAWVYDFPGHSVWLRNAEVSGLLIVQSGQPFTPRLEFDNSNTGNTGPPFGSDRPNVVGNPERPVRGASEWFNPSAFAVPPRYTFGNAGRNSLTGPGLFTVALSLARQFQLREHSSLTFEVQAFNLLNRTNFDLPLAFADQPTTFGRIFSAEAPRQIQMALRLRF